MRTELNWLTPQVNTALSGDAPATPADPHADHRSMPDMDMTSMPMSSMAKPAAQPAKSLPANAADADWDRVLAAARQDGIRAAKVELRQPKARVKPGRSVRLTAAGPPVDAVSVNPQSFAIVDHVWFDRFPLVAKLTRWVSMRTWACCLAGLISCCWRCLAGLCSMIVLGYRMWWLRRPALDQASPAQTLSASWLALPHCQRGLPDAGAGARLCPAGDGRQPAGLRAGGRTALAQTTAGADERSGNSRRGSRRSVSCGRASR